uniref:Uncharacterized protein LOC105049853 n=1 Tax=Elaeis guineensis var. tenera TaxID=51953 RepID=A0A6I9RK71_ELAGV|nr:uncharacterized protein LOC105049853 [Elaeis guineensis]
MNTGRHQIFKLPKNSRKEQDEDLLLFREMFKREKERTMSLLQPVSDEFEPGHGNYPLYKISSSEKNDYDWLKTPPATPLFPSLEMEANDPDVVVHKELPVLRSFKPSRFSGQSVEPKHGQRPKSPSLKSSSSSRSVTPSTRPNSSSGKITLKGAPIPTDRPNKFMSNSNKRSNQLLVAPRLIKEAPTNSTITPKKSSETKPRGRGVSPLVRSTIPATILGFSSETPPNLITTASVIPSRASSATRGRPGNPILGSVESKLENGKSRRQSCSPSVSRGRKVDIGSDGVQNLTAKRRTQAVNKTFVVGSRMVEKVMNARGGVSGDEKDPNPKHKTWSREGAGYGRMMPRASLDMALKHMV